MSGQITHRKRINKSSTGFTTLTTTGGKVRSSQTVKLANGSTTYGPNGRVTRYIKTGAGGFIRKTTTNNTRSQMETLVGAALAVSAVNANRKKSQQKNAIEEVKHYRLSAAEKRQIEINLQKAAAERREARARQDAMFDLLNAEVVALITSDNQFSVEDTETLNAIVAAIGYIRKDVIEQFELIKDCTIKLHEIQCKMPVEKQQAIADIKESFLVIASAVEEIITEEAEQQACFAAEEAREAKSRRVKMIVGGLLVVGLIALMVI